MKSGFIFIIAGLIIFSSLSFNDGSLAHGEAYHCPDDSDAWSHYTAEDLARIAYEGRVGDFNSDVESRSGSIEELNELYMQPSSTVGELNQMAGCLYEEHHIDPDSVATFSDKAQDVLSYDMEKLIMTFPDLANYAEVPEFGVMSMVALAGGVSAILLLARNKMTKKLCSR